MPFHTLLLRLPLGLQALLPDFLSVLQACLPESHLLLLQALSAVPRPKPGHLVSRSSRLMIVEMILKRWLLMLSPPSPLHVLYQLLPLHSPLVWPSTPPFHTLLPPLPQRLPLPDFLSVL